MVKYLLKHKNDIGAEVLFNEEKDPVVAPSAERLYSYMEFKGNIVRARQNGLTMKQIEDGISLYLDKDERKDINKGWPSFWNPPGRIN